jgi:hypothetical protein
VPLQARNVPQPGPLARPAPAPAWIPENTTSPLGTWRRRCRAASLAEDAYEAAPIGAASSRETVVGAAYGIGGPGQVPPGPTSVSPCALCAGSALFDTVITTNGFFAEFVR